MIALTRMRLFLCVGLLRADSFRVAAHGHRGPALRIALRLPYVGISVIRWRILNICISLAYMGYLHSAGVYYISVRR